MGTVKQFTTCIYFPLILFASIFAELHKAILNIIYIAAYEVTQAMILKFEATQVSVPQFYREIFRFLYPLKRERSSIRSRKFLHWLMTTFYATPSFYAKYVKNIFKDLYNMWCVSAFKCSQNFLKLLYVTNYYFAWMISTLKF